MTRIREWPIYCTTSLCMNNTNKTVPGYARNLHDVVYLYGIALNNTVDPNEVKRPDIMQQRMQTTFDGLTGQVTITENNSRDAIFLMYTLNEAYDEVAYANISFQGDTALRKLDHENVNRFIGLSIDGVDFIAVWKMCARGSLQEIISKGNLNMDQFFVFCLIRDIAEVKTRKKLTYF
ncbi:hypothetical protein WR25_26381 [Diploscapter pachys]|uniref:Receptor ligand binding region domain-containing protein n=1 Tax=Diploscapter pachys TaxID=2018661 RepID=A0A2A2JI96_9BILA|nr:hypothetical protein WR25_26381 [Diploscapter pachys]